MSPIFLCSCCYPSKPKLAQRLGWPCPVRSALKSTPMQYFNHFSIIFYYIISTTYQKIGDLFCPVHISGISYSVTRKSQMLPYYIHNIYRLPSGKNFFCSSNLMLILHFSSTNTAMLYLLCGTFYSPVGHTYTANVNRQTTDKLLFSHAIITDENM